VKIEETTFSLVEYRQFLEENRGEIELFEARRQAAFAGELEQWKRDGQLTYRQNEPGMQAADELALPEGVTAVDSPVSGNVWKLLVAAGDSITTGDTVMLLESMKMEIEIHATRSGCVEKLLTQQGQAVTAGQTLLWSGAGDA